MTQYVINIGAIPNDGTGDPLRTAFNDVNLNFDQVWATGLVGSNITIANNTIRTTNTNGNLVLAPNGIGIVQANAHVVPDQNRIRNLGSPNLYWDTVYVWYANVGGNLTVSGGVTVNGPATLNGNVLINGNLQVEGNVTYIDSNIVDIKDKNITLAYGSPDAQTANGGGITIAGANAQLYYNYSNNSWTTNLTIAPPSITFPDGSVLDTANTVYIGETPLIKADGNLWFNSDDGRGYIKYNDQWIEFCPPVIPNPATYLGNLTIDGVNNSTLYFPPGGAIVFGDDTVQTTAYTGANTDWANIGNINNANGPTQIAIGQFAGANAQSTNTIAIGVDAGNNTQHDAAIAIGQFAGQDNQGNSAVGLGKWAGQEGQHEYAVAVGTAAGAFSQGNSAVAIGDNSGHTGQKSLAIAIGQQSGYFLQGANAVAIGAHAGDYKQGNNSIILNATGGILDQQTDNTFTVAPVRNDTSNVTNALYYNTSTFEISYGPAGAGGATDWANIGNITGTYGPSNIAIGSFAGNDTQGIGAIAIGSNAGTNYQGNSTVAIGAGAGYNNQSEFGTAVGYYAGNDTQGYMGVAVGISAGQNAQGNNAVALGPYAGQTSQGQYTIAIGDHAGAENQANNTIILNATGSTLNGVANQIDSFYVAPVRNDTGNTTNVLSYNTSTNEITYASGFVTWTTAPVSNTSVGTPGQAAYDAGGNLFVCVSANTWSKFSGTTSW